MGAPQIIDAFLKGFEPWWFFTTGFVVFILAIVGLSPVRLETDVGTHGVLMIYFRRVMLGVFAALLTLALGAATVLPSRIGGARAIELGLDWCARWLPFLLSAIVLGAIIRFLLQRYVYPPLSKWIRSLRREQETDEQSDIRKEITRYEARTFRPSDYYKDGFVFTGINNETGEPLYIPETEWLETHSTTVGATRFGKGVTWQAWIEQGVKRGDSIFLIDPKGDRFLPKVMEQACQQHGRRFFIVDLKGDLSASCWSPFTGGDTIARRSRFFQFFDLNPAGDAADHYRTLARGAMFDAFNGPDSTTLAMLLRHAEALSPLVNGKPTSTGAALSTTRENLREWLAYPKLRPPKGGGFDIARTLLEGGVVYVRGDLDDAVLLTATRAIILEITQQLRALKEQRQTHCTLYIDELRALVSEPVLRSLATVLDCRANIVTGFQNFGDLLSPADDRLDGQGTKQSVMVNSQIKLMFGGGDFETAEWVEQTAGSKYDRIVRMEKTEVNRAGGESWSRQRTLSTEEVPFINHNKVLALPRRVAVLLRTNALAEIISVARVEVRPDFMSAIKPAPASVMDPMKDKADLAKPAPKKGGAGKGKSGEGAANAGEAEKKKAVRGGTDLLAAASLVNAVKGLEAAVAALAPAQSRVGEVSSRAEGTVLVDSEPRKGAVATAEVEKDGGKDRGPDDQQVERAGGRGEVTGLAPQSTLPPELMAWIGAELDDGTDDGRVGVPMAAIDEQRRVQEAIPDEEEESPEPDTAGGEPAEEPKKRKRSRSGAARRVARNKAKVAAAADAIDERESAASEVQ